MKRYGDIPGDGGSAILEQVLGQRQAVSRALAGVEHVVAVGSGKGGVGKSTVAFALALASHRRGRRAALLDADLNGPCQARLAGLEGFPWVPTAEGRVALPRRADGLGVVSTGAVLAATDPLRFASRARGDEHTWRASRELTVLSQLLATVEWGELDLLVIDLPPGTEATRHHAGLVPGRTGVVLVTLPAGLAGGVVARTASALDEDAAPLLGYVLNMDGYRCPTCGDVQPLFAGEGDLAGVPRLGNLPFDPRLAAACDSGWPGDEAALTPLLAPFAAIVDALWDRLDRTEETT